MKRATIGVAAALVPLAAANGGYFPTSWGWAALVYAWLALLALVLGRGLELDRTSLLFVVAVGALVAWTWLSAAWSRDVPATILEGERALVYVTGVLALVTAARRASPTAGALVATTVVCLYSLATRVFPSKLGTFDSIAGYRLASPIGYWNGLGLFAAIGLLLGFGFAVRSRHLAGRAAAAATLVPLAATVYFTFSRGAWLALFVAALLLVAVDARRLQLVAAGLPALAPPAVGVLLASRSHALTTLGAPLHAAVHEGSRLAIELAALAVVAGLAAATTLAVELRWAPRRPVRTVFAAVLVVAVAAGVAAAWAGKGSPVALARRGWHGFVAPPAPAQSNLNSRLFSLSGEGRIQSWHAALREFESAPAGGTGAGTFENWWLQHRATADQRRDAHSLYLETLGELGIVGLLLLAVTIAVPLVTGIRRRRSFAVAAFACWAVHAAADWDWELSAVTLLAFACAVACCVDTSGARSLPVRVRAALGVALAAVAAFAVVVIVGNAAVAHSEAALRAGNDGEADLQARRAQRWAPWSAEPWLIRGQIQVRAQDVADAKASLEQAAALEPANYLVWYALAGVEQGPARSRAAAAVVRLNPMSQEAQEMRKVLRRSAGTGG